MASDAGDVIEIVPGRTYEGPVRSLVFYEEALEYEMEEELENLGDDFEKEIKISSGNVGWYIGDYYFDPISYKMAEDERLKRNLKRKRVYEEMILESTDVRRIALLRIYVEKYSKVIEQQERNIELASMFEL